MVTEMAQRIGWEEARLVAQKWEMVIVVVRCRIEINFLNSKLNNAMQKIYKIFSTQPSDQDQLKYSRL